MRWTLKGRAQTWLCVTNGEANMLETWSEGVPRIWLTGAETAFE